MDARKVVLSLGAAACLLCAQGQTPKAGGAAPAPLVRLNVVALDSAGQPVADLNAGDFKISEQGKNVRIAHFRKVAASPAQPAPNELSNRAAAQPGTTVILFDLLHHLRPDGVEVARTLGRSLKQLESGESVYLYVIKNDTTLVPIHPLQTEAGKPAPADKTWQQKAEALLDQVMQTNLMKPSGQEWETEVKKTYVVLETLANQLGALPGRRDLLWITNHVPDVWPTNKACSTDWIDCALYVPHLSVTLDRSGVTVTPVSILNSSPNPENSRKSEEFAGLTGARPYSGEDVGAVIKHLADETRGTYAVAFETKGFDNKFHKLRVTCERKGIRVQAKQRYYSIPDVNPAAKGQAAVAAAAASEADFPEIGIRAMAAPVPGQKAVRVQIRINPADLLLNEAGGAFDGQVGIAFANYGASGLKAAPAPGVFNLHLTREQHDTALKEGLLFGQDLPVDETVQKLRFIIFDYGAQALGSLTVPVVR